MAGGVSNATDLVALLREKQEQSSMNDSAFALHIGVSQPMWSLVKAGKRRLGTRMLGQVVERYPRLADAVVAYVRETPAMLVAEEHDQ